MDGKWGASNLALKKEGVKSNVKVPDVSFRHINFAVVIDAS